MVLIALFFFGLIAFVVRFGLACAVACLIAGAIAALAGGSFGTAALITLGVELFLASLIVITEILNLH